MRPVERMASCGRATSRPTAPVECRARSWRGERMADTEVEARRALVAGFRREHAHPLTLVTVGPRQFLESVEPGAAVGQRLKRMDRILEKLVRFPEMKLARMQDVGGCRRQLDRHNSPDALPLLQRDGRRRVR